MEQTVLAATESVSRSFYLRGTIAHIMVMDHSGGTWVTEMEAPNGTWIDLDVDFNGDGVQAIEVQSSRPYRLSGGTVGASALVIDNREEVS